MNEVIEPEEEILWPEGISKEDEQVIQYLQNTLFSLEHRLDFVMQTVAELRPIVEHRSVNCPTCGTGLLRLAPDRWHDPGVLASFSPSGS